MRLSDLLKSDAYNESGERLGHVHDVRFESGAAGPNGCRATALIVGKLAFAERLGYSRGTVKGPWLVAAPLRWASGHARIIPWEAVVLLEPGRIVVRGSHDSFVRVQDSGPRGDLS